MKTKPLFAILMMALLLGFGNTCICVVEDTKHGGDAAKPDGRSLVGCQQPIYTQGMPGPNEYTVVVGVFSNESKALGLSQKLRGYNIHNYCYQQKNGCWVVSVGRYWDAKPAQKMLNQLVADFGYTNAEIRKSGDKEIECHGSL
ncbi:MAG: SPOR domain-containing protein [candidate division KSB1 bacterium]|nr:SPOR domain-containing protein [candidate division KSB1 bacterium]MDZ7274567.1 SPOR domain-containing protein [candidate division KSB1 bacterium]MDZ7284772.1 SPOR domain-containing protein [candidate division KSB1 bacterium]MDZ7297808.1 SPOR domain-containing protein [candidate division KSB1 bacterium]MDZ7307772.1 SPOR domain-containing protein [candidate division KSB1 bacterium]